MLKVCKRIGAGRKFKEKGITVLIVGEIKNYDEYLKTNAIEMYAFHAQPLEQSVHNILVIKV